MVVSVVNHSNPELLAECLRSLVANTRRITFEVWVVDNATDRRGVVEMQREFPTVCWLFNERRLGFSANHNQVLRAAQGRHYCILNDDTVIHENALDELVSFLDSKPQVGMVGPRTLNPDGSIQNSTFRFMTVLSELAGLCFLPRRLQYLKDRGLDSAQYRDEVATVDWLLGACLVVRGETLRDIGPLDSELSPLANTEDTDWCRQAWRAGWQVAFCPASRITHYGGQSLRLPRPGVDWIRVEMMRTRLVYFAKNDGKVKAALVAFLYAATFPWNAFVLVQSLLRRRTRFAYFKIEFATYAAIAGLGLGFIWRLFWRAEKISWARTGYQTGRCVSLCHMRRGA